MAFLYRFWIAYFCSLLLATPSVFAGPTGGQIEAGTATILQPNTTSTIVEQKTDKAVAGFESFNLNAGEQFTVIHPGSHAILWVKDYQKGPSQLHGSIDANGQVWISNRNGILVGESGQIDTAGTLLTSSFMRNQDFMAGTFDFTLPGNPSAAVINEGLISAHDAGLVGLVAPGVVNDGVILARLGRVGLASGNRFTLDVRGDGLFRFAPDDEVLEQVIDHRTGQPLEHLVSNTGLIHAPGGLVALSAVNTRLLLDSVIDNSGRVLAPTYETQVGKVTFSTALPSQQRAAANNPAQSVRVSGTIDVSGRGENQTGGEILILGEVIGLTEARLDASGDAGGGLVLVGGTYFGDKLTQAEKLALGVRNPEEVIQSARETLMIDSTIVADALTSGVGGQVVVRGKENAAIQGSISAKGERGIVDTSGLSQLVLDVEVDVSNPFGGEAGHWGIDPGNITIDELIPEGSFTSPFTAGATTTIAAKDIEAVLDAGGDVHILTDGGRVDVVTDIQKSSGDESTLRFDSTDGFTLATGAKIERVLTGDYETNRANLNVIIDGNTDRDGTGTAQIDGQIISRGGDISVKGQRITLSSGALQSLNDPDGEDGNIQVIADVTAPFPARSVISLETQAITAGSGSVYVEARSLANDDTISFGGAEAIRTIGQVTVVADQFEANPSAAPHINIGTSSPEPVISGTQSQPVVVGRSYFYTPSTPPPPIVDNPPTAGAGTFLNHTITTGESFSYTLPADAFADDAGVTTLTLTASGQPTGIIFSDNQNGTGTFSGSSTTTGTFTVTVLATDTNGASVSRTFRIVVEAGTVTPPVPPNTPPTASLAGTIFSYNAGEAFSFTTPVDMFSDDGGVTNLTLTAIDLQPWMTFVDNGDGTATISGTPPDTNTYRPTIVATDAGGLSVQKAVRFQLSTNEGGVPTGGTERGEVPVVLISQPTLVLSVDAGVNNSFSITTVPLFSDDGGIANLSFSFGQISTTSPGSTIRFQVNADGSLTLLDSATTRLLTEGWTENVRITATDSEGQSVSVNLQLTVNVSAAINPNTPVPVDQPPQIVGGTFPDVVIRLGEPFAGLNFNTLVTDDGDFHNLIIDAVASEPQVRFRGRTTSTGGTTILGLAAVDDWSLFSPEPGTYVVTVTITDANNNAVQAEFAVTYLPELPTPVPPIVDSPPTVSTLPTFTHTASVFGDVSLAVSRDYFADDGGTNNLSLSVRSGFSLPDGTSVTISPDGTLVVAGAIRTPGTFTVPVEATDASGQSVTRTFTIVFDPGSSAQVASIEVQQPGPELAVQPATQPTPVTPVETVNGVAVQDALAVDPEVRLDRTESVSAINVGIFNGLTPADPAFLEIPASYPASVRNYIARDTNTWRTAVETQPNLRNFAYYEANFGSDAAAQFIYDYKRFVEGKSPNRAAYETLGTSAFGESEILADVNEAGTEIVREVILIAASLTAAGVAIDINDFSVAVEDGDPVGVVLSGIGFVPVVGDLVKRGSRQVLELSEESARKVDTILDQNNNTTATPDATNSGRFSGIRARNADEAQFLRNAEATFGESTTWTSVTRHRGELVVQRSDIELSPQNTTRMQNGQAPFVRNANGEWEPLQLHHVGRETGQMIEVTRSQNRYNPTTGGPLHIPGPGSPIRQPNYSQTYWQERYQGFVAAGQIVE